MVYIKFKERLKDKRYVKKIEKGSVDYTTESSEAYILTFDCLVEVSASDISDVIDMLYVAEKHTDWKIVAFADKEETLPMFELELQAPYLSVNIHKSMDPDAHDMIKLIGEDLKDFLTDLYLKVSEDKARKFLSDAIDELESKTDIESCLPGLKRTAGVPSTSDDRVAYILKTLEKTKASLVTAKETLDDYVCNDTLKTELQEIVDFFKYSTTFKEAGVKVPTGILLKGPPGTGKTYAAKCIAGTTDAYFFTCTASSLQGMYIGSGTENIRNIFTGLKELQKASGKGVILFIDEIDSLGNRNSHSNSSSGEEDRTLNQMLAEMSGFDDVEGIMVIAATNYPERLDDALIRSGRFDRHINIDYPEAKERYNLVEYYFSKIKLPLEESATYSIITSITEGLAPADIKSVANEAGIFAIRHKSSNILLDDINEAVNKVITKNIRNEDDEKTNYYLIAAHEIGHVYAEYLYFKTIPIKVTNYSYGNAGGFTQSTFRLKGILEKEAFIHQVKVLLAGRAAEEVLCGMVTNGASNDLSKVKHILENYYKSYNFESYEVDKLAQKIIDDIAVYYSQVVLDFKVHKEKLKQLTETLHKERILYNRDLSLMLLEGEGLL